MTNFFNKKLNKKGFTLAELLIVVAIIAILVAIAVPIFTAQLNKAKVARDQANVRSVKAAAIAIILDDDNGIDLSAGPWTAVGTIDDNNDITEVELDATGGDYTIDDVGKFSYPCTIEVEISGAELKAPTGGSDPTT